MSDELAKLDSNIMRLRLQDLKKNFAAVLASGYIFFFNADRARKDSTSCFIYVIAMLLL
jgi:hypothetical protein